MNRQQRRYEDDSRYRHIHVDLEDIKEPLNEYNRKTASFDEQEPEEAVLKISPTNEYVAKEKENRHIAEIYHRGHQENDDRERYVCNTQVK